MLNKRSVEDLTVAGKRVLVRCDFNVPMKDGEITDDARIRASLPTVTHLLDQGARVILLSHLGRPGGQADPRYSLAPVAKRLSALLKKDVVFVPSDTVVDDQVRQAVQSLSDGDLMLLENTRFRPEETKNEDRFSRELASLGDAFVNDAFGTAHRAHCSNVGISRLLPSALGFLVKKEVDIMGSVMENPQRPFVAILGGAKVSDKIGVIENLLSRVDTLLIGGGMSFTFFRAMGYGIGTSLLEEDKVELAGALMKKARETGVRLLLPVDLRIAGEFKNDTEIRVVAADSIPEGWMGLDIGPETLKVYEEVIGSARTVIWNGPMGVFEMENFSAGTFGVARALASSEALSIIGGGDSAAAAELSGLADQMSHISTGGGASLEFFEGKELPGIAAISDR